MSYFINPYKIKQYFKLLILLAGLLASSCGVILSPLIHFKDLPFPSGYYSVGTNIYTWEDQNRKEWFTNDPLDNRKIVVQIWYPTAKAEGSPIPYLDQWQKRIGPISEQIDVPKMLIRSIKNVDTNSYLDAPILDSPNGYPLVIFSHGLGGMRMQNTIQMETLASHGYVALAVDHAYDANVTLFDDGSIADYRSGVEGELSPEEFWKLRLPQIYTRAEDVSFVLDYLEYYQKRNIPFWKLIDMEKIGVMGHSFGGGTAIVASSKDSRLDACIVLDSWLVPVPSEIIQSGMKIPFLYMGQEAWDTPLNYLKLDTLISTSSTLAEKLLLPGTKHFDYSDTPQFTPLAQLVGVSGKMPALAIKDTLNTRIISFFNKYLGDK